MSRPPRAGLPLPRLGALATLALVIAGFAPAAVRSAEPQSFYVNYSARVPTAPLLAHPLSIVHPDAEADLAAAHTAGNTVLAYLSVGEVAADAPYRAEVRERGLPFAGRNEVWKSDVADLRDARWAGFLVDRLARAAAARGFRGFFLDTLDAVELIGAPDSPERLAARTGLVAVITRLRAEFPQHRIVVNRGFFAFPALRELIDGVLVESLFETHDFATKSYRAVPESETAQLLAELDRVTEAGRAVYVLDYTAPHDANRARAAATRIRALGFHAFISTPALDGEMLAPLQPVTRRICAFYGNQATTLEDQRRWPADSFVAQRLQMPLEWLGYEVDYLKIARPSDLPALGNEYRAIVMSRFWEPPLELEPDVVDWLLAQRTAGRKLIFLGGFPLRDARQRQRLVAGLGLGGTGAIVPPPLVVSPLQAEKALLGYEAEIPPLPVNFLDLRAPAGARIIHAVEARPEDGGPALRFDSIFTCDWGGAAFDPYVFFRRADFREFWHVDPFAFVERALGEFDAPAPDVTTRDGLRLLMSHIDGDGFANFSRVELGRRSAEVVRDRVLKKYPVPVTVSIIEAELRALIRTQRADDQPVFESIAREIFALPNVEPASHSFSHPFFWIPGDREAVYYDEQNLDLKVPYTTLDLEREIEGSIRYINERLVPPGKPVRVFLWSGNCRPPPEALARVRQLGLENVNGGDTIISPRDPTLTAVAPRTMPWDDELQVHAPNQNENVYTNDWRGPLFGTFIHAQETFELTESPRRLKPVDIYYHFYSGDYPASLRAVESLYEWALSRPMHAITLSHYAQIARDARQTVLYAAGADRWIVVNGGVSRTVRLPAAAAGRIDLGASRGVTGWNVAHGQTYLHTDGSRAVTIALSDRPRAQPWLESSTAEIAFTERSADRMRFTVSDLRPATVILAGVPGSAARISIDETPGRTVEVPRDGRLELTLPAQARVLVEFVSS